MTYAGISKDGTSVFFTTIEQLAPDTGASDSDGTSDIYVRDDDELRLVSIGSGGAPSLRGRQRERRICGVRDV